MKNYSLSFSLFWHIFFPSEGKSLWVCLCVSHCVYVCDQKYLCIIRFKADTTGFCEIREALFWIHKLENLYFQPEVWIILANLYRGTAVQEPWGSFLSDTGIFITQRILLNLLSWKSVQDVFQSQDLINSVVLRLNDFIHGMESTCFWAWRITLPFLIAAIVLDLISYFVLIIFSFCSQEGW